MNRTLSFWFAGALLLVPASALANSPMTCPTAASACTVQPDALLFATRNKDGVYLVTEVRDVTHRGPTPALGTTYDHVDGSTWMELGHGEDAPSSFVIAWWRADFPPHQTGALFGNEFRPNGPAWCTSYPADQVLAALELPVYACKDKLEPLDPADAWLMCLAARPPARAQATVLTLILLALAVVLARRKRLR